jgi:hypothetical protein
MRDNLITRAAGYDLWMWMIMEELNEKCEKWSQ